MWVSANGLWLVKGMGPGAKKTTWGRNGVQMCWGLRGGEKAARASNAWPLGFKSDTTCCPLTRERGHGSAEAEAARVKLHARFPSPTGRNRGGGWNETGAVCRGKSMESDGSKAALAMPCQLRAAGRWCAAKPLRVFKWGTRAAALKGGSLIHSFTQDSTTS